MRAPAQAVLPPAAELFGPLVALEGGPETPLSLRGIPHAWERARQERPALSWFERVLPGRARAGLCSVEGLEGYAVRRAADVPVKRRTPAWKALLALMDGYEALPARRQVALLQLLLQLCLHRDCEALLRRKAPPAGKLDEVESNRLYLASLLPFMLFESELKGRFSPLLEAARRAAPGTRVRFLAALRYMVLSLECRIMDQTVAEADALAREALVRLEGASRPEKLILESKYWRAACYVPFHAKNDAELARQLDKSEALAREALGPVDGLGEDYARENLYSVLATRAVTSLHRGDAARARGWFESLIALDPRGAWQRLGLGRALLQGGSPEEARRELEAGFALGTEQREQACLWLAECLEALKKPADARDWRRRGHEIGLALRALAREAA